MPLIFAVIDLRPRRSFLLGWAAGTAAYAGILSWVVVTFLAAGQSLGLALPCLLVLSAYLGLYWGAWTSWLSWLAHPRGGVVRPWAGAILPLAAAAAWTALEWTRTWLFTGFPWALLGDTQWRQLPLIQIASLTGVYGVSFLVVLVNATFVAGLRDYPARRTQVQGIAAGLLVTIAFMFGLDRLRKDARLPDAQGPKVAVLQGSIDQYAKWDKQYVDDIQKTYGRLNDEAAQQRPALIVWPETSVPGYLLQEPALRNWLTTVVRRTQTSHIVGAPSMSPGGQAFNSAFSLNPQGKVIGQYDKQHLVPFGEVVPLTGVLGRWIHVLNDLGGFAAGHRSPVLDSGIGKIGVNICYEAIFPNLVRRSVLAGATAIVNITNDGWYMRTAAPYQHFIPNVFRAVENGRWVIRADNTGISCFISPVGEVQSKSPIFLPLVLSGTIVPEHRLTFYTRHGDIFAWACLGFCFLFSLRGILRRE